MIRLLVGVMVGLALAGAAAWELHRRSGGCLDRCGTGTACQAGKCVATAAAGPAAAPPTTEKRRRRRASAESGEGAASEPQLRPGDEAVTAQGDAIGRPEHIDLTQPGDDGRDLSEADIERVFAPARDAITGCITRAVGDYPLEHATIEVGYRIERSGRVERVRVSAPALLQRQGLYRCVRPIVGGLRFPASGGASVVTFPFELR